MSNKEPTRMWISDNFNFLERRCDMHFSVDNPTYIPRIGETISHDGTNGTVYSINYNYGIDDYESVIHVAVKG